MKRIIATITSLVSRVKAFGALPTYSVTWGLVAIFSFWIVLDLTYLKVSSGLSQTTYDAMVKNRFLAAAPDPRLVIVDIDEASLARMAKEFGRWPWSRDTLASVQDFIEREEPAAIVWDIMFADPDRLSPGGDAAFNASAKRSTHSHYPVIRLPHTNDGKSQLTAEHLPTLWAQKSENKSKPSTLAVVVPFLPSVAASPLGYNNGHPDSDGILRRYRYSEVLADGSVIQSTPLSATKAISKETAERLLSLPKNLSKDGSDAGTLIAWRKDVDAYPRIAFADVFEKAEGGKPSASVPSFKGKVVVIGGTAPSLHDIHPTPLASYQPGVESLATVIDNGLNARIVSEVPRLLQALIAISLCVGLAFWVRRYGITSLDGALVVLPGALLGISYLSLNLLPIFLDLQLAAGAVLLFLATLRFWNNFRRNHWCGLTIDEAQPPDALLVLQGQNDMIFDSTGLDALIDQLERHAPTARVVGGDTDAAWPAKLRWPELACYVGVVGSIAQLQRLSDKLPKQLSVTALQTLEQPVSRLSVVNHFFRSY
ncbi:MAG: hypothetical protein RLY82_1372 [Pseudomonadota bacterium]|jgi:CHASE2 domain-containing sensor protein